MFVARLFAVEVDLPIVLKSDITLELKKGATLLGDVVEENYPYIPARTVLNGKEVALLQQVTPWNTTFWHLLRKTKRGRATFLPLKLRQSGYSRLLVQRGRRLLRHKGGQAVYG